MSVCEFKASQGNIVPDSKQQKKQKTPTTICKVASMTRGFAFEAVEHRKNILNSTGELSLS